MSGNEIIGKEEFRELKKIFTKSGGVLFAHGFEKRRKNIFRTKIFENKFAKKVGAKFSVCCSSGTAACTIALTALGVKRGDEVITQAFTFIATVESILMIGAKPIIADTDSSLNMCPIDLKKKITKKTKCIIPVHMLGQSCEMDKISKISKKNNIPVIEDACEALGAKYKKKYLGTISEIGFFSFDFGKIITTGEGGMLTTNNEKIYTLLKALRDHGHENKKDIHRGVDKALLPGFNFRMTELQAAVGIAQINKLDKILRLKKNNFLKIKKGIIDQNKNIQFRINHKNSTDQYDVMCIYFKDKKTAIKIFNKFKKQGISTSILPLARKWHFAGEWKHIWKNDSYYKNSFSKNWIECKNLLDRTVSIPISILETKKTLNTKLKVINNILSIIS
mgnify:CR=1 FL=1